jgi:hypothetical protein
MIADIKPGVKFGGISVKMVTESRRGRLHMRMDNSGGRTKDISVLQLLTRLVQETDRIIRLADDIDQCATTPQAKSALNLIGSEVNNVLQILKVSLDPLYRLYELDPGMKMAQTTRATMGGKEEATAESDTYDENALWAEVKSKAAAIKPLDTE